MKLHQQFIELHKRSAYNHFHLFVTKADEGSVEAVFQAITALDLMLKAALISRDFSFSDHHPFLHFEHYNLPFIQDDTKKQIRWLNQVGMLFYYEEIDRLDSALKNKLLVTTQSVFDDLQACIN